MRINIIDQFIESCKNYKYSGDDISDEKLKDMLVKSLLILIYAEFEKCFNKLVLDRCPGITDISILEFIKNNSSIRSLKLSSIRGFIGQFGEKHKNEFNRLIGENSPCALNFESLRNNRNSVAHGDGSSATFSEVVQYYQDAHLVLDHFKKALWM
ncbi:MAG: HEPN domain-containing protein [Gammaproteobacteria bacterium]|nr:HEPN domain-containing protein [Gammaproteobacteria bacterium]